ncbi:MAG: hypothetical protein QXS21_01040 [Thermoproteota archaeon]|nr:hypothetical protein [Candidatus Brockarchaeota archaeon]MBO3768317.1 hypothetical protein [Candidatus Brockarchaeota archaeon]MBO3800999.1 hypothetical protein [Candidatus Brockarchaeota archaeon]
MVKTPFHEICLSTEIFCQECKEKINTKFSFVDVTISRLILELLGKKKEFENLEYVRSVEDNELIILIFNETNILELRPKTLNLLLSRMRETTKKDVVIADRKDNLRTLIEKIAKGSVKILYIRKLWLPDGSEAREVKIRGRLKFNEKEISQVLSKVLNERIEISLEEGKIEK